MIHLPSPRMMRDVEANWVKDDRTGNWVVRLYDRGGRARFRRGDKIEVSVAARGQQTKRLTVRIREVDGRVAWAEHLPDKNRGKSLPSRPWGRRK